MKRIALIILVMALGTVNIPVYAQTTEERIAAVEAAIPEIELLLEECTQIGLDAGYEVADLAVIKDFISYGREDIEWGHTERAEYVADCLEELCASVKATLESYIDLEATPLPVKKNHAADYAGDFGSDFVDKNGNPVIFNGYGAFDKVKNDVEKLPDFAADIIQFEIGPNSVLAELGTINGWGSAVYGDAVASMSVETDNGDSYLKIVNETASGSNGYIAVRQDVSVKPDTTYTLSFSARTLSAGRSYFSPQGWTADRCYLSTGTSEWTDYSIDYTTSAEEYSMEILFISNAAAQGIFLDNISLAEKNGGENLIQNGDFESSVGIVSEHFQANTPKITNSVTRVLDRAYESGVMVNLLISPHYFPQWILNKYPEVAATDCGLGYDINSDIAKEALELYIKAVMTEVGEHPALHSICISNEPKCDTRDTAGLEDEFAEYLIGEYEGSIATLNKVYSTSYKDFTEVPMPESDTMDAAYYDWVQFNNAYTAGWHKFLADTVKKYAPDMPVHSKMMTIFGKSDSLNYGIDPEDFAEFTDYSGNDAWGFLGSDASGLISKLMWYDLLGSIKPDAPVINSEDHIIEDRNENYESRQAQHVSADIWQGAVHGRDASIIWIWGRTSDKTANTYGNILYRPDVLSKVSRRSLDINRMADRIAALQKADSSVSILYSPTTRAYQSDAVSVLKLAYTSGLYAGVKPKFITERQLENGAMPDGVLVIPAVTHISDGAWQQIAEFKLGGGTIIMMGENCLGYDEHNTARTQSISPAAAVSKSISKSELSELLSDKTATQQLSDLSGNTVTDVEIITTEYEGKALWNLCNYSWDSSKTVSIAGAAVDLLTGIKYSDFVTLNPFEPMLLEFCEPEFSVCAEAAGNAVTRRLQVEITNSGGADGYLNISITVRTADGAESLERADVRKYVRAETEEVLKYEFTAPSNGFTATVTARTDDGVRLGDISLSGE